MSDIEEATTDTPLVETVVSEKEVSTKDIITAMIDGYLPETDSDKRRDECNKIITKYLKQEIEKHPAASKYNILILHDTSPLIRSDADRIYNAVTSFSDKTKPILLVLYSSGGDASAAYLIGQLCREFSNGSFLVSVPRFAKSAATLLSCAANEIHMGSLSELGPIDPQINQGTRKNPRWVPALGLKQAVEHIAKLVESSTNASEMFAQYLHLSLKLIDLGYYERIAESAEQYAEKLLATHQTQLKETPKKIAHTLVHEYKDHGFVIDQTEAEKVFGEGVIKQNTQEYDLGNNVYKILSMIEMWADNLDCHFFFIGSLESLPDILKKKQQPALNEG